MEVLSGERMVFCMNNSSGDFIGKILGVVAFFALIGLIGSVFVNDEPTCIKSGCDNHRASGSSYCYLHKPSTSSHSSSSSSSTYDSSSTSHSSSGSSYDSRKSQNDSSRSNSSYSSSSSSDSHIKNRYNSDMYKYDNADDYADDYTEDYAYDEFGEADSDEAYDYGYDEAYDDWEEEMDD